MADEKTGRRGIPLHTKILIGLIVGAVAGVTSNYLWRDAPQLLWIVDNIANPIGQIFLRMLFMVVVPLVFTSLALGVAGLGDLRKLGRIGGKTFGFFLLTTALAVTLGLLLANVVRPGDYLDALTTLYPSPLLAILQADGFDTEVVAIDDGFRVRIVHAAYDEPGRGCGGT